VLEDKWFIKTHPRENVELRMICFPYAGGSAYTYSSWAKALPRNVELVAVQLPGRSTRFGETPYSDMKNLVDGLIQVFPNLMGTPYILMGHSLGSRIAFELMNRCKQECIRLPRHFIASGSRAPHIPDRERKIHQLPEAQFIEELQKLNGTPVEIIQNEELMALTLPFLRADFTLSETYQYTGDAQFDCPITVLDGDGDSEISLLDIEAWGDHFSHPADIHTISGDHFFIEKSTSAVLEKIRSVISDSLVHMS